MPWHGETNPLFRPPPPDQHQHSLPLPPPVPAPAGLVATTPPRARQQDHHQNRPQLSEDQHPRLQRPRTQDQHFQPSWVPFLASPQPQAQAQGQGQHAPVITQAKNKPKSKDGRHPPLGDHWSKLPMAQEIQPQPSSQQPQPQGTPPGPQQPTLPKHHHGRNPQPHREEAANQHQSSNGVQVPKPTPTKLSTWFLAWCCAIFGVAIILGGLIVLIVYLLFRPHYPRFDVSSITLNAAYLDAGVLLNADLTVLANFSNPNKKVKVDFSYVALDLYYGKTLIASRYVEPFSVGSRSSWFTYVHMVTSQVRLPLAETERLVKELNSNAVVFQVKGVFRARSDLRRFFRYSYWLYSHCTIVLAGPPSGVIRAGKCKTKR